MRILTSLMALCVVGCEGLPAAMEAASQEAPAMIEAVASGDKGEMVATGIKAGSIILGHLLGKVGEA